MIEWARLHVETLTTGRTVKPIKSIHEVDLAMALILISRSCWVAVDSGWLKYPSTGFAASIARKWQ